MSDKPTYAQETLIVAETRAREIAAKFQKEVAHLMGCGAIDPQDHNRGLLFGVALENVADDVLRGDRKTAAYRNLNRF